MKRPALGQQVTATDRLRRWSDGDKKTWATFGSKSPAFKPQPVSGMYVGSRTKQNGRIEYDYDYGFDWYPSDYFTVWLIIESDRTNPVYVLPEDVSFDEKKP